MKGRPIPNTEALIVGGGPAGASLACRLAHHGRDVIVLEQSANPQHKVCGEFLSYEATHYLEELGLNLKRMGAVPIHGVRLSWRKSSVAEDLPFPALSLTRRRLDEELLQKAVQAGAVALRGNRVDRLENEDGVWRADLANGKAIYAPAAFLATGKHDLCSHRRPAKIAKEFIAFKMYWRLSPTEESRMQGWVELFPFCGGYAGLQLVGNGEANLCVLVRREFVPRSQGSWSVILNKILERSAPLATRLDGAIPLLERPIAISSIPYGLLRSGSVEGPWFLGDQTAVVHSLVGDGISIALHSAKVACELFDKGRSPCDLALELKRSLRRPIFIAGALAQLILAAPWMASLARIRPRCLRYIAEQTRIPARAINDLL